jgi:ribosomal-protein-alanine N-acetyltransferase
MSEIFLKIQRPLSEKLPEIVELDQLCLGGLWTLDGYQRELDNPKTGFLSLTSRTKPTDAPELIGCGCFWSILEEAHITLLMIHPDYRGRGLGNLLLYSLLKQAVTQGLERATLEVKDSNTKAIHLYKKFGFKLAGKRKKYYQKTGEDALIFWRNDLAKPSFLESLTHWQGQIQSQLLEQNCILEEEL